MNWLLSAIDKEAVSYGGIVTVYLLLIVFAVLALLIVVLVFGNKLLALIQKATNAVKSKFAAARAKRLAAKQQAQATLSSDAAPTIEVQAECEEEVVAAITAALSIVLQGETRAKKSKFVVRKIERI